MQIDPDDRIEAMKRRLHGEILRVIGEHNLHYDDMYHITGHYFDRVTMYRLREYSVAWSPKKYIRVAKALGIEVPEIVPVPGQPAPRLAAVLATRRARQAALQCVDAVEAA